MIQATRTGRSMMRGWRLAAMLLAAVVLLLLVAAVSIIARIPSQWDAFLSHHREEMAAFASQSVPRPRVEGQVRPGSAWEDYEAGLVTLVDDWKRSCDAARIPRDLFDKLTSWKAATVEEKEMVRKFLVGAQPALSRIQEGTFKSELRGTLSHRWMDSGSGSLYEALRLAASLFFVQFHECREGGDLARALDHVGVVLQFALDQFHPASPGSRDGGLTSLADVIGALRMAVADDRATSDLIERIERIAAAAEHRWPRPSEVLEKDRLRESDYILRLVKRDGFPLGLARYASWDVRTGPGPGWRQGYSKRWLIMQHAAHFEVFADALRKGEGMDLATAGDHYERVIASLDGQANALTSMARRTWQTFDLRSREVRAQFRLIRAAAMTRLGKDFSDPAWPGSAFDSTPYVCRAEGSKIVVALAKMPEEAITAFLVRSDDAGTRNPASLAVPRKR